MRIASFSKSETSVAIGKIKVNTLSANPTKWSNTPKTIRRQEPTNCLSVFDHFGGLALKGLIVSNFIKESFMK